jgi:NadR type nicotinamide-nucleotide adenylyltransferase
LEIKKVVILGPECTGKSELSEFLAHQFDTAWVPEFAREYLDNLQRPYGPADLPAIAQGQLALEDRMVPEARQVLFCDTDLYVIKVWSLFKYGHCDIEVLKAIERRKYDLYLLTDVDIPWVHDPLREHPDQREVLYDFYLREMKNQSIPFVEIRGDRAQRRKTAAQVIQNLLRPASGMKGARGEH